jgi:hypothetical protein
MTSVWTAADLSSRFTAMGRAHNNFNSAWNRTVPPSMLQVELNFVYVFLAAAGLAAVLDARAAARLRDALAEEALVRALARIARIHGDEFILDRELDGAPPCAPAAAALDESRAAARDAAALAAARRAAATHALPLHAVARAAPLPVDALLDSGVIPADAAATLDAALRAVAVSG